MTKQFFLITAFVSLLASCTTRADLINDPQVGDIYILAEKETYYPMKIDSIGGDKLYLINSQFVFTDAVPEPSDLPDNEFDHAFHLIYEKAELNRLFVQGHIIEIYRE